MDFEKSKFLKIIVLNSDHLHTKFNTKGGGANVPFHGYGDIPITS